MVNRRIAGLAAVATLLSLSSARAATPPALAPTPGVACAAGSLPEGMQGRAPLADVATGRAAKGYTCNAVAAGHAGISGGYRVERYVDPAGHECAYSDNDSFVDDSQPYVGSTGVYDVHDRTHPVRTETLSTPAMASPHESLRLNQKRGLLVAAMSTPATGPGVVDVYDVKTDCRHPQLLSSTPLGILGHESAFAPDGLTFYVNSLFARTMAAIDLSNPALPQLIWMSYDFEPHGASISLDGNRMFLAETGSDGGVNGLTVIDISQIQSRTVAPQVKVVSRLAWQGISTPQNATPFTRGGHPYLLETDEFGERVTGAARIIDMADEKHPVVAANLRLKVNQPEVYDELQNDPGNGDAARGYQAHYCTVPSRVDPNIVACSFIMSGLRVFDIRDVRHPRELAYFNQPHVGESKNGACALAAPAYDPESHDIWYADGNTGFWVVHLTGAAGAIPFAGQYVVPGS
jgi:hypothetical protein